MDIIGMDDATTAFATLLFASLAHPTRLKIVELLTDRERTVSEVAEGLDRFHLAGDVIDRVPALGAKAAHLKQHLRDKLLELSQAISGGAQEFAGGILRDDVCLLLARRQ